MKRVDGRANDQLRPVRIELNYQAFAEGSALIEMGNTRVLCSVSVEDRVPNFLKGEMTGWVTAEYGMLPRSTHTRTPRATSPGKVAGRTQEIQRLIGRSLRATIDLHALGYDVAERGKQRAQQREEHTHENPVAERQALHLWQKDDQNTGNTEDRAEIHLPRRAPPEKQAGVNDVDPDHR